jgi:hypothetical protein
MSRKTDNTKIEFSSPATIGELIEALEDLRSRFPANTPIRALTFLGGMRLLDGSFIRTLIADPDASTKGVDI